MALVKCPICNRYMSARVASCIYCGQSFKKKQPTRIENKAAPQPTKIGELQKDTLPTVLLTVGGLALAFVGFLCYPLGLFLQLAGGAILWKANTFAAGYYQICCPICRRPGTMQGKPSAYCCPSCSEESKVIGSRLYPPTPKHSQSHFNTWLSADEGDEFD